MTQVQTQTNKNPAFGLVPSSVKRCCVYVISYVIVVRANIGVIKSQQNNITNLNITRFPENAPGLDMVIRKG